MPTYDYRCDACGHELELFHGMTEDPVTTCPKCGEEKLRRRIGSGAGIIFKGSGFYETDYKRTRSATSDSKPKKDEGGKKESSSDSKSDSTSDSKSSSSKKDD